MFSKNGRRSGFTLIELLVVLSIIIVLISMILPAVGRVRNMSMSIKCQANVHTLMTAFFQFAADHDSCLPGADRGVGGGLAEQPWQQDWLSGTSGVSPQGGTIWPYVSNASVFLCPAMDVERGSSNGYDAYASNGRFDYGFFTIFNGAPIRSIPRTSQMTLLNGGTGTYPTPIICQEEGYQMNGYNVEGNHSNVDQMSHIHNGGSYYSGIDGSINFVVEPDAANVYSAYSGVNGCWQWTTIGPHSHATVNLGTGYTWFGYWTQQ
jgi:prepilin-type N-terminal cleavage/methylation domain-containing protein